MFEKSRVSFFVLSLLSGIKTNLLFQESFSLYIDRRFYPYLVELKRGEGTISKATSSGEFYPYLVELKPVYEVKVSSLSKIVELKLLINLKKISNYERKNTVKR